MLKELWNKLTPTGKKIALAVMAVVLVFLLILGFYVKKQIILFFYDRFVYPEQLAPVDFSTERDVLACYEKRIPERVKTLCFDAFIKNKK